MRWDSSHKCIILVCSFCSFLLFQIGNRKIGNYTSLISSVTKNNAFLPARASEQGNVIGLVSVYQRVW